VIGDIDQQRRELEATIVKAYQAGVPKPEIQRRFGVSRHFVRPAARRGGLPPRPRWPDAHALVIPPSIIR
jgi:transposase